MPLISYNTSVGINENENKQQTQVQPHDLWNAHHTHNTCSTNSLRESTGSVKDTVPGQQNERKR
jgi:hypothetical protein